jgi:hypothetical protein
MPGKELEFENGEVQDADPYDLQVWVSGGAKYHESRDCPRGDVVPSLFGFAVDADLEPCGKCAQSFEAST